MLLPFYKYQGSGNDFIIIDDRALSFPLDSPEYIAKLCHRRFGIGADGLILLQTSTIADFRMRIFNADGAEASMCGNGLRCLVKYIHDHRIAFGTVKIQTENEVIFCSDEDGQICLHMAEPHFLHKRIDFDYIQEGLHCSVVLAGVPHAVVFCEELQEKDVDELGYRIRHASCFAPYGVNVNFVKINADFSLSIRTYERGVEGQTYSCGTGAVASAFCAVADGLSFFPVKVIPLSEESLEVGHGSLANVYLKGRAHCVFSGTTCLSLQRDYTLHALLRL